VTPSAASGRPRLEALAFAILALYVAGRWAALVADPPGLAVFAIVIGLTAVGALVARTGPPRFRARGWAAARPLVLVCAAAAAALAVGLPARMLLPAHWDELAHGIAQGGTVAIQTTDWPYRGGGWVRLSILLVVPVALTAATALAFWPLRRRAVARVAAAAVLVALFGIAAVQQAPATPLLTGALLAWLLCLWLFGPALRPGRTAGALMAASGLAIAAIPVSAALPASAPIVNYEALAFQRGVRFNWDHTYGPITWPRDGRVMLQVQSADPHYWKAETLDEFDGRRWIRSARDVGQSPLAELPPGASSRWQAVVHVTIGDFDTADVVAPGPIISAQGISGGTLGADGTEWLPEDLKPGDSYTVRSYAPDPSAAAMRHAPAALPAPIRRYRRVELPRPRPPAPPAGPAPDSVSVRMPRFDRPDAGSRGRRLVSRSPYARTYRLARRLASGAPSAYDVVLRMEQYLRSNYVYSETPPAHRYPLPAFLFRDRAGYCQQFSGALALMLRLDGIPARVAAGFAPGEGSGTTWTVTDQDAHSWTEVYFAGIGWVPFDPTPPGGPARSVTSGVAVSAARGNETPVAPLPGLGDLGRVGGFLKRPPAATPPANASDARKLHGGPGGAATVAATGGAPPATPLLAALAALVIAATALGARAVARRLAPRGELADLELALAAAGRPPEPALTLARLEAELRARGAAAAARHVELLRRRRYGPSPAPPLEPRARRAFHLALAGGAGPLARLRARAWLLRRLAA